MHEKYSWHWLFVYADLTLSHKVLLIRGKHQKMWCNADSDGHYAGFERYFIFAALASNTQNDKTVPHTKTHTHPVLKNYSDPCFN